MFVPSYSNPRNCWLISPASVKISGTDVFGPATGADQSRSVSSEDDKALKTDNRSRDVVAGLIDPNYTERCEAVITARPL
jgi:hypothetical protein